MNSVTEKVSIIVPIYKVENYLDRCVQSLINQTYQNIEIILVDDGSPDNCPRLCDSYLEMDSRIIVIHKSNGGLSDARNAGLRIAKGKYVLYVDSDDYIELDACEKLLTGIVCGADVVVGICKEIRGREVKYQRHTNLVERKIYTSKEYMMKSIEKNEWYASAWLNLYRRDFLIGHNLFYRVGYYFEDIEMLPRLFLENPKVCYVDYPFYNYVIRENSIMTSGVTDEKKRMAVDIYMEWMRHISKVDDQDLQRVLYGILVRYYMATARRLCISGWKVKGMNFCIALKYALNSKERVKVIFFSLMPRMYRLLGAKLKNIKQ